MNNTQQAGETALQQVRDKYKTILSNIEWHIRTNKPEGDHLKLMEKEAYVAEEFIRDITMVQSAMHQSPTPAPDAVEAKEFDATALPEVIKLNKWMEGKDLPDALKLGFKLTLEAGKAIGHVLAGHAEGQKATVEAKSAGVWVNELRRLLESESVKALLRFAYKNPMRSGMDDFEGKEYIDLYHFDTSVMQPSTPTSHAEGEKGAVGFAHWIAQNDWSFSPVSQMWHNKTGAVKLGRELYNLYLTC